MPTADITIRLATLEDLEDLVRLRRMMFESMGYKNAQDLDAADKAATTYFQEAIPSGEFHGWLAVTPTGQAIGSGGAVIDRHPPGPNNLSGRTGYIVNIGTMPEYRHQGIAGHMILTVLAWLSEQNVQHVTLHASDMGRSLYEKLGFSYSNEMRLQLKPSRTNTDWPLVGQATIHPHL
jgi:ribosomal protein S18 acetylase RimI-like enzyme